MMDRMRFFGQQTVLMRTDKDCRPEVSSSKALITSLLKLGAFASLWPALRKSMVEALNHGKAFVNASSLYAESAAESTRVHPWTFSRGYGSRPLEPA